jgi:hypothetical protein
MSSEGARQGAAPGHEPQAAASEPSEEELRAAYEEELSRITSADVMLQAAVSLLNLGGRRLGLPAGAGERGETAAGSRDLEQVRDAIDGVRALLGVLERGFSKELGPLRDALSQLQLAYAREAQAGAGAPPGEAAGGAVGGAPEGGRGQGEPAPQSEAPAGPESSRGRGPAEASGRLWVPGR